MTHIPQCTCPCFVAAKSQNVWFVRRMPSIPKFVCSRTKCTICSHAKYIQCMRDLHLGSQVPFVLPFKMPQYLHPTKRMMECWSFFKAIICVDVGRGHINYRAHSSGVHLKAVVTYNTIYRICCGVEMLVNVVVFSISCHSIGWTTFKV